MGKIKVCRKCGVPRLVSKEQNWLDNGVIQQTMDKANRMVFYESDNLSRLFEGIEGIIGLPIEHIVIESKRLDVKEYTEKLLSPMVRKIVRRIGFGVVAAKLRNLGACYGYGAIKLGDSRRRNDDEDYQSMLIRNPPLHNLLHRRGAGRLGGGGRPGELCHLWQDGRGLLQGNRAHRPASPGIERQAGT